MTSRIVNIALLLLLTLTVSSTGQTFTEIGHTIPAFDSLNCQCFAGRGVSFADFDGDGWADLTYATTEGDSILFLRNDSGSFEQILLPIDDTSFVKSVLWSDLDNDGDKDLVLAVWQGQNKIYRCDSAYHYTDVTAQSGMLDIDDRTSQVTAGDLDRDGLLDLFVANYEFFQRRNYVYINEGELQFTEVGLDWEVSDQHMTSFLGVIVDFNRDGWQDVYLINDKYDTPNVLYQNIGGEYFEDVTPGSGAGISIDAMDAGIGDFNEDGLMDVYVTNTDFGNVLLKNLGNMQFVDYADSAGVTFDRVGWGGNFFDVDNDTDFDLHVCGIESTPVDPNAMYINNGPPNYDFEEINIEGDTSSSFSEAVADFNRDGYVDFALSNNNFFRNQIFMNNGDSGLNWLKIRLKGTVSNRDGVGALITCKLDSTYMSNYTCAGEAYLGQNDFTEHFGLGNADTVDAVYVYWPSGIIDTAQGLLANRTYLWTEGNPPEDSVTVNGESLTLDGQSPGIYEIYTSGDAQDTLVSEADGSFQYKVPLGDSVNIRPYKNDQWDEGVSIVDLIEIQQHITQSDLLDSPYEYIAADANNSQSITISDLVILLNIITGNLNEVSGNTSYRFVPSSYQFADPLNPLQENFPESASIGSVNGPLDVDFKAIKIGDVYFN